MQRCTYNDSHQLRVRPRDQRRAQESSRRKPQATYLRDEVEGAERVDAGRERGRDGEDGEGTHLGCWASELRETRTRNVSSAICAPATCSSISRPSFRDLVMSAGDSHEAVRTKKERREEVEPGVAGGQRISVGAVSATSGSAAAGSSDVGVRQGRKQNPRLTF